MDNFSTPHRRSKEQQLLLRRFMSGGLLLALCVSLMGTFSACDMKMPWDKADPKKDQKAEGKDAKSEGGDAEDSGEGDDSGSKGGENDSETLTAKATPFEEITLPMRDRLSLSGKLYGPFIKGDDEEESSSSASEEDADKGPKYPLVVLLHGLDRNQSNWGDFPGMLVKSGYAVLAVDLRGHGKSTRTMGGRRVTWRYFKDEQWKEMPADIGRVIHLLTNSEDYPQVDAARVVLIGEKLGANVAVLAAQKAKSAVQGMALIAPGLNYKGLMPSQAIQDFNHPVLLMCSQTDEYGYKSTHGIYNWILNEKTLMEYGQVGDGADMLIGHPNIEQAVVTWLGKVLPTEPNTSRLSAAENPTDH